MTRYLLYSHDTYGLGHFRRSTLLAAGLVGTDPDNEVLIVTGSPRAQVFRLPDRVDTVKLPAATKDAAGCYRPRKLAGPIDRLVEMRAGLIAATVGTYRPDTIVVDHAPMGMRGELEAMFELIDQLNHRPRLVLGLREIIDDAHRVEAGWHRDGVWDALDRYDDILVYGDPRVLTTAQEIGLARRTTATVTHTGYMAPAMPEPLTGDPFLLVTPGGGGDGQVLLRRFLDAAERGATAGIRSLVVTGPLLSASRRAELLVRAQALSGVEVVEFSDRMRSLIASAIGVVSMAGYNTVVEELAAGTPSLLVPRRQPRLEQHIRASRLAPVSMLEHCPLETITEERIADFVEGCRRPTLAAPTPLALCGVANAVAALSHTASPTRTHTHA